MYVYAFDTIYAKEGSRALPIHPLSLLIILIGEGGVHLRFCSPVYVRR